MREAYIPTLDSACGLVLQRRVLCTTHSSCDTTSDRPKPRLPATITYLHFSIHTMPHLPPPSSQLLALLKPVT